MKIERLIVLVLLISSVTAPPALSQANFESSKLAPGIVTQGTAIESSKLSSGIVLQSNSLESSKLSPGIVMQNTTFQSSKLSVGVVVQVLSNSGAVPRAPLTHW